MPTNMVFKLLKTLMLRLVDVSVQTYGKCTHVQNCTFFSDMEGKRYLLKSPNHLLHIEAMVDVFPDANFIFTHRNLTKIVPSYLSLLLAMNEQFGGKPDIKWRKRLVKFQH